MVGNLKKQYLSNKNMCMKNKILTTTLVAACWLTYSACEDGKDEFLNDFTTILSFRNYDEIPLTMYRTGENTDYQLIVNKSGSALNTTASASIEIMDDATLSIYNAENGKSYKKYPDNCYSFNGNKFVEFGASDSYQTRNITLFTEKILENNERDNNFVIPFMLYNGSDSINAKRKYVFVKPSVIIPLVSFGRTGYSLNTISDAAGGNEVQLNLPVDFSTDNRWTFNCEIATDETLLNAFNEENEVDYAMLPTSAYKMSNNGNVAFTPGNNTSNLDITVNRSLLSYGNFVLPLRLTDCTSQYFHVDEANNTCLFGVSYVPDESKLHKVVLTKEMISIHPNREVEGSVAEMLDGRYDTYYHSDYSVEPGLPHYIQVALPESHTALMFEYQVRHSNNNGAPQRITILGSMNGENFSKIMTITEGLPTQKSEKYKSPVLVGKEFKHVRVRVEATPANNSFAFAEFSLHVN